MSQAAAKIEPVEAAPLSPLHAMLPQIERRYDALLLNRIVNQPDVLRWVKGYLIPPLDLTPVTEDRANVALVGKHGGIVFTPKMTGIYECHTQVEKAGRGKWALAMAQACLHLMFTRTDCLEVFTHVPKGNLGARVLTQLCKFSYEFEKKEGWVVDLDPVPTSLFSLKIQDWMRTAPGCLERGQWFHRRLEQELKRFGKKEENHRDDPIHDQYVGAAIEMAMGGNAPKAMVLYNRWAAMAGYEQILVQNLYPLIIDIRSAVIRFDGDDFYALEVR